MCPEQLKSDLDFMVKEAEKRGYKDVRLQFESHYEAVQARAVRREQDIQMKLRGTTTGSATEEAEELIARVLGDDDPFEQSEIMDEINKDLDHSSLTDRMADAGFGDVNRTTAQSVLARLKAEK